jgi:hypothetical protein
MNIKILGSKCAISDEYLEAVDKIASRMGLDYTIEKIEDESLMENYEVTVECMYGYCPGCKFNHEGSTDKHAPAMVIDEELVLHSEFPIDEVFEEVLNKFK